MLELKSKVLVFNVGTSKYSYGTVENSATNDDGKTVYAIKDNGAGISAPVEWKLAADVFLLKDADR